jgi:hypothetical protein
LTEQRLEAAVPCQRPGQLDGHIRLPQAICALPVAGASPFPLKQIRQAWHRIGRSDLSRGHG